VFSRKVQPSMVTVLAKISSAPPLNPALRTKLQPENEALTDPGDEALTESSTMAPPTGGGEGPLERLHELSSKSQSVKLSDAGPSTYKAPPCPP
jgi:hypothetical protein